MSKYPGIRFLQFNSDWEHHKLEELFDFLQNNTLSRAALTSEGGSVRNIHYGDVLVKYGEYLDASNAQLPFIASDVILDKCKGSLLQDGDIIMVDTAEDETVGKCTEISSLQGFPTISGLHTIPIRAKSKFAPGYLGYYFNSSQYHDQLYPLMQGIKVTSVSKGAIQTTQVAYPPELSEQAKIGQFFIQLDQLITLHQLKLSKYKDIRTSLLQEMFCPGSSQNPDIRFSEYAGKWERMPLNRVLTPYTDYLPTPTDGYTRLGIRSHMKGTFYEYVAPSKQLGEKRLQRVKRDNFIVNIVFAWEHAIAVTTEEDEGKLVSHRFPQFSFNAGMHPRFFHYALNDERFRHHLWLASPSGAGRNKTLRIDEMLEYELRVPGYEEQKKIADFLTSLDELIELYDYRITKLQNIKAACLQGMFV